MGKTVTRGELRTYLGIAPGVGKTYQMLRDGRALQRSGRDVVIAYLERHGRAGTAAQVRGLELLPTRPVTYRGRTFQELDVDGVMDRSPEVALVDELAHANLPGERHAKRWQDVDELLSHGISVHTTLNVANLDSLRKLVAKVTGARAAEPVPDAFVRSGEVKLIHLEPAALRKRVTDGLVFPQAPADLALSNYFRFANLAALQEIAALWLDESVVDEVAAYRESHGMAEPGKSQVVVVGLAGLPSDEWLICYASNLARLSDARLVGVHVAPTDVTVHRATAKQVDADRQLLKELGGRLDEVGADDVATGLVRRARKVCATQLVVGAPRGSRWKRFLRGFTVERVRHQAGRLPVQVVAVGEAPFTASDARLVDTGARRAGTKSAAGA